MIKNMLIVVICLVSTGSVFIVPDTVHAQTTPAVTNNQYTALAPIPGITDGKCDTNKSIAEQTADPECNVSAGKYIPQLVVLAIQIAGALAVLMIVIGGIQYATADAISGKSEGKGKIENAIKGLLLAIGAYVIMYTINPSTLSLTLSIPSYYGSAISSPNKPAASSTPVTTPGGDLNGKPWPSSWPGGAPNPTDASLRADFSQQPTKIKVIGSISGNKNCSTVGEAGCTSLDGLSSSAVQGLKSLASLCQTYSVACKNGGITVTAGTEFWLHTNRSTDPSVNTTRHRPGGGAVDLSKSNSQLNTMIMGGSAKTNLMTGGATGGCNAPGPHYIFNGVVYVDETGGDPHWHVCY